jgi:hypothetical protein
MNRDTATGLLARSPLARGGVRQVAPPPSVRALSTLARVDYDDAAFLEIGPHDSRTAERWARAILEDAPPVTRRALRRGWFALGLKLGSARSERLVLGWEVRRSSPDFALLGASGRLGLQGEVLCKREQETLLVVTFVQLDNVLARAVWARVAPGHRHTVRHLLEQASRRERRRLQRD